MTEQVQTTTTDVSELGSYDPNDNYEVDVVTKMIEADDANKIDLEVDRGQLEFLEGITPYDYHRIQHKAEEDNSIFSNMDPEQKEAWELEHMYGFNKKSFSRFVSRLGIPFGYLEKYCEDWLVGENVRAQLERVGAGRMLLRCRTREDEGQHKTIRGICGPSFVRLDNKEIWDVIAPTIKQAQDDLGIKIRVWRPRITDESFHARIIFEDNVNMGVGGKDDPFNSGIHICNSELGLFPVRMDQIAFRLVCTNGMVAMADGRRLFQFKHSNADKEVFKTQLGEQLRFAIENRNMPLEKITSAAKTKVGIPAKVIRRIGRVHGIPSDALLDVLNEYEEGVGQKRYEDTRMDVINAITRVAQMYDARRGLQLETIAGRVLVDEIIWSEEFDEDAIDSRT